MGARAWFGEHTRHWWALVVDRLLEGDSPRQLADRIREVPAVRQVPATR